MVGTNTTINRINFLFGVVLVAGDIELLQHGTDSISILYLALDELVHDPVICPSEWNLGISYFVSHI
jgi:hypothetical protein